MEDVLTAVLVPLGFFAMIFAIVYTIYTTRNRERMALIEKGESAEIFKTKEDNRKSALKAGMLFMGVGLGIILGYCLQALTAMEEEVAYFSMIFLWGGIGLVLFYFLPRSEKNGEGQAQDPSTKRSEGVGS